VKKIVITGGPRSGKKEAVAKIENEFGESVVSVPSAKEILLNGGYPFTKSSRFGAYCFVSRFWSAAVALQNSIEEEACAMARARNAPVALCDGGIFDGAAFTVGGLSKFTKIHRIDAEKEYKRYEVVILLKSPLVNTTPLRVVQKEARAFDDIEKSPEFDDLLVSAWKCHRYLIIAGDISGCDCKVSQITGIVRFLVEKSRER